MKHYIFLQVHWKRQYLKSSMNYQTLIAHIVHFISLETHLFYKLVGNFISPSKNPLHLCYYPVNLEDVCNHLQETLVGVNRTINHVCEKRLSTHSSEPPHCVMNSYVGNKWGKMSECHGTGLISSLWSINYCMYKYYTVYMWLSNMSASNIQRFPEVTATQNT